VVDNEVLKQVLSENSSCLRILPMNWVNDHLLKWKSVLCYIKPYRTPFALRPIIANIIFDLLKCDIIRPSNSGIFAVNKKNGEHCLCVDYRRLNSITLKIPFPNPNLEEQFARFASHAYFTQLDLRMGYHQIEVSQSSKPYNAFVTLYIHTYA